MVSKKLNRKPAHVLACRLHAASPSGLSEGCWRRLVLRDVPPLQWDAATCMQSSCCSPLCTWPCHRPAGGTTLRAAAWTATSGATTLGTGSGAGATTSSRCAAAAAVPFVVASWQGRGIDSALPALQVRWLSGADACALTTFAFALSPAAPLPPHAAGLHRQCGQCAGGRRQPVHYCPQGACRLGWQLSVSANRSQKAGAAQFGALTCMCVAVSGLPVQSMAYCHACSAGIRFSMRLCCRTATATQADGSTPSSTPASTLACR